MDSAQNQLKSAVEKVGLDYLNKRVRYIYGPKIDFMATDAPAVNIKLQPCS